MTKRERIYNLIEGKEIDRCPAGFWIHFPMVQKNDRRKQFPRMEKQKIIQASGKFQRFRKFREKPMAQV